MPRSTAEACFSSMERSALASTLLRRYCARAFLKLEMISSMGGSEVRVCEDALLTESVESEEDMWMSGEEQPFTGEAREADSGVVDDDDDGVVDVDDEIDVVEVDVVDVGEVDVVEIDVGEIDSGCGFSISFG